MQFLKGQWRFQRIEEDLRDKLQRCVNITHVYGQEKFLIMKEIEVRNVSEPLTPSDAKCDVACLVYDCTNPKSFEYVARIYLVSHQCFGSYWYALCCRRIVVIPKRSNVISKSLKTGRRDRVFS